MTDHDLLVSIATKVTRIESELFGNGQAGFDEKLAKLETKVDERTSKRYTIGAGGVGALLVGVVGIALRFFGV